MAAGRGVGACPLPCATWGTGETSGWLTGSGADPLAVAGSPARVCVARWGRGPPAPAEARAAQVAASALVEIRASGARASPLAVVVPVVTALAVAGAVTVVVAGPAAARPAVLDTWRRCRPGAGRRRARNSNDRRARIRSRSARGGQAGVSEPGGRPARGRCPPGRGSRGRFGGDRCPRGRGGRGRAGEPRRGELGCPAGRGWRVGWRDRGPCAGRDRGRRDRRGGPGAGEAGADHARRRDGRAGCAGRAGPGRGAWSGRGVRGGGACWRPWCGDAGGQRRRGPGRSLPPAVTAEVVTALPGSGAGLPRSRWPLVPGRRGRRRVRCRAAATAWASRW